MCGKSIYSVSVYGLWERMSDGNLIRKQLKGKLSKPLSSPEPKTVTKMFKKEKNICGREKFFSDWGFLQEKCNFVYIVMKITPKNLEKNDLSSVALENV